MTDTAISTITAAAFLFAGQVVTVIQNVMIARKTDQIHTLTDGSLSRVLNDLKAANTKIESQSEKVQSLEKMVALLVSKKGDTGATGATGKQGLPGEPGETGEQGPRGTFGVNNG